MLYFLNILDNGLNYKIIGSETHEDDWLSNVDLDYKTMYRATEDLYNYVSEKLSKDVRLYVLDRSKIGFEGAHITRYDITESTQSTLFEKVNAVLAKKEEELRGLWTLDDNINFFLFITSNNKLIEKGIILTEENTETKMKEILESKDEEALSLAKTFTRLSSKFKALNEKFEEYKKLKENIHSMDEDELDKLLAV